MDIAPNQNDKNIHTALTLDMFCESGHLWVHSISSI